MKEVLISSTVLIVVLLLLRRLFWHTISRRVQYALWAIVLLRLLIPVNLPSFSLSVLNVGKATQTAITETMDRSIYMTPVRQELLDNPSGTTEISNTPKTSDASGNTGVPIDAKSAEYPVLSEDGKTVTYYADKLTVNVLVLLLWKCGMAATFLWFLISNLYFWLKLQQYRTPYPSEGCNRPVYLCDKLPTPCLFGFFKPSIYLTPAAVKTERSLCHVCTHEEMHARHLDPLWSLLRCVCLIIYWFNPLVWIAAAVSKSDCELACDEATIRLLGEEDHILYGQTLLSLVPVRKAPSNPLLPATTMTAGKRQLKDRITRIAENRRTVAAALVAVMLTALLLTACTFTGAQDQNTSAGPSVSSAMLTGTGVTPATPHIILPEGIPDSTIQLLGKLTPYSPETVAEQELKDISEVLTDPVAIDSLEFLFCLDTAGNTWAAYRKATGEAIFRIQRVYWYPDVESNKEVNAIKPFTNVLGYDGFFVSYLAGDDFESYKDGTTGNIYNARRYYFFNSDGQLCTLAHAATNVTEEDWDKDGNTDLIWSSMNAAQLYFRKGGELYQADMSTLLRGAYPDWDYMEIGTFNVDNHNIIVNGYHDMALANRYIYFDGEALLSYKDTRGVTDHVMSGVDVPNDVLETAKSVISEWFNEAASENAPAGFDDWRIENLTYAYTDDDFEGMQLEIYNINFEYHATNPQEVGLAGGSYITEDDWAMLGSPYCTYLIFEIQDGQREYLLSVMENDCSPGSHMFTSDLRYRMLDLGLLSLSELSGNGLLNIFSNAPDTFNALLEKLPKSAQTAVWDKIAYYKTNGFDQGEATS